MGGWPGELGCSAQHGMLMKKRADGGLRHCFAVHLNRPCLVPACAGGQGVGPRQDPSRG